VFQTALRVIVACLAVAALPGLAACREADSPSFQWVSPTPATENPSTPVHSPSPAARPGGPRWPVTLAAAGDVMLARSVANAITAEDPGAPFAYVRDFFAGADMAVVNLECAISDVGAPEPKAYTFRAPPLAVRALAAAGIDVVALANNHAGDYGMHALLDTLDRLDAEGIASVGAGPDEARAYGAVVVEREGVRFAFLAFAEVPVEGSGYDIEGWRAGPATPGIAWLDDERVLAAIGEARADADIVVVLFHYGQEGHRSPSSRQVTISHAAVDAGADLVIGSHPHVLQEVEEYGGGLIAYSLGNFVFDGFDEYPGGTDTAILEVTFGPEGVRSWNLVPARIGWDGLPRVE